MSHERLATILEGIPETATVTHEGEGVLVTFAKETLTAGKTTPFTLQSTKNVLALARYNMWWMRPTWGEETTDHLEIQYLLFEHAKGGYAVVIPLVDGDYRAYLSREGDAYTLHAEGAVTHAERATLLFVMRGNNPYVLTHSAMATLSYAMKTFRMREEKNVPAFVDYFGWCTWDAFYHDLSEEKVLAGLASFHNLGIAPKFMILDDGWQDAVHAPAPNRNINLLRSFSTHPKRFPKGLAHVIARAKSEYGIACFGVWHAFQGYWEGVSPEGPLAKEYAIVENNVKESPYDKGNTYTGEKRYLVDPKDIYRFYNEMHRNLRDAGVDMIKVDNQSSTVQYTKGVIGHGKAMRTYQEALQGSAHTHFGGNLLHCMSNTNDVLFNMKSTLPYRNSDDFFPTRDESHQFHVHTNAMNNLFTGTFTLPDWDMFQSAHHAGAFHAAARAISGGPVYVSDKPEAHDAALLKKLFTSDGRVLRSATPALPTKDRLFVDCYREKRLLKIANTNNDVGVLGIFHCYHNEETACDIEDTFTTTDVPALSRDVTYAVYAHEAKTLALMKGDDEACVTLAPLGYEVYTLSPVKNGIAPLGLLTKFNGSAALDAFIAHPTKPAIYTAYVRDGGAVGFYVTHHPKHVLINDERATYTYDEASGLLVVTCEEGTPVFIRIAL